MLGDFSIWAANPDGTHQRRLTHVPSFFSDWSPDGRWITFNASPIFPGEPGFHTDIWIMRADGSHERQLTSGGLDVEPVFSPDGRRIAFNIAPTTPDQAVMAVHPNGKGLRVIRRSDNRFELFKPGVVARRPQVPGRLLRRPGPDRQAVRHERQRT